MGSEQHLGLRRYSPDLCIQMATCDANYIRLLKLLPDMNQGTVIDVQIPYSNSTNNQASPHAEVSDLSFSVSVIESFKYTSTIEIIQASPKLTNRYYENPEMQVRVYHDASTAEVISYQHIRHFKSRYELPNQFMHQPDEKQQLNVFLSEWLNLCLSKGVSNESVLLGKKSSSKKKSDKIAGVEV